MTARYALAHTRREDGSDVAAYLPGNYKITAVSGDQALIEGEDNAGWTMQDYVLPRLGSGLVGCREIPADEAGTFKLDKAAREVADSIIADARGSGNDPIAWVTGNRFMPPLRSFSAAEQVWQDDEDGGDFAYLAEEVERLVGEADVALVCPDYDNALYAVDLKRFEYVDDPGDHETLQQDWRPVDHTGHSCEQCGCVTS